jgi:hypothetical protein
MGEHTAANERLLLFWNGWCIMCDSPEPRAYNRLMSKIKVFYPVLRWYAKLCNVFEGHMEIRKIFNPADAGLAGKNWRGKRIVITIRTV